MTTNDTLRVTDSRTGRSYELPIVDGAIRAIDLRQIKTSEDDFGLLSYDPAFQNTASVRSAITFIDGDKGILRYRGYPIDELAKHASFLDVSWLLLNGELPDKSESASWAHQISQHTYVHENIKKFIDGFHYDAHPMGILVSTLAALSTFYPEAKAVHDRDNQDEQIVRLIAKMPTLAAFVYRHARGLPYAYPDDELSYAGNFLNMMRKMTEPRYVPDPVLEHAVDVLLTLHADHEQNCSTNAMRGVASSGVDPYSAAAAAAAALYGPLHGGANEQVLKMLREIGSVENVPAYIKRVKSGELRLMGAHIDVSYVMPAVVNTELGSGLGEVRGVSNLEPTEVADAIVEALQLGTVDVWVPKSAKRQFTLGNLLPRALAEGVARAMKADRVLAGADHELRRGYELRAARSEPALTEPALDPAPERQRITQSAGE